MARRVRVALRDLAEGERALDPETAHYLVRVVRLRGGDPFLAFDPTTSLEAEARLVTDVPAVASFGAPRPAAVLAPRGITWIHALPKGDKSDAIVEDATELGATRIVFAESSRSVPRIGATKLPGKLARWNKIATAAARQSGRGDVPTVELTGWGDALASVSPRATRIVFHVGAPELDLPAYLREGDDALAFSVGPEGGLTDDEVAVAVAVGFQAAGLGAGVLRTETVVAAVLGAIRLLGIC